MDLFLIDIFVCSRETGALNRIIDRGSRAINFILSAMVFNVVPTVLEVTFLYLCNNDLITIEDC